MRQYILLTVAVAMIVAVQSFSYDRPPLIRTIEEDKEPEPSFVMDLVHGWQEEENYGGVAEEPVGGKIIVTDEEIKEHGTGEDTEGEIDEGQIRSRRSPKEPATGKIIVQGGARKGSSTGGKTEGQIYVGGQIRFRRSAEEALLEAQRLAEEQVEDDLAKNEEAVVDEVASRVRRSPEPKRRRTNVDVNAGKTWTFDKGRGSVSVNGGASKRPGERWDPHVGVSGTFRF